MDLRIWGRVEHIGPDQFVAIASAVPTPQDADGKADVLIQLEASREAASKILLAMMKTLGKQVLARGDRVLDVEEDGAV